MESPTQPDLASKDATSQRWGDCLKGNWNEESEELGYLRTV